MSPRSRILHLLLSVYLTIQVTISYAGKAIPKSPYSVKVEGAAGDPEKVTAEGPGLQATGVQHSKKTFFEVFTEGMCTESHCHCFS